MKRINDVEIARAVIGHEAVECFLGEEGKPTAPTDMPTSCTGKAFWGPMGDTWPRTTDGKPLLPWLQIVCTEIEGLRGPFWQRRSVCYFIDEHLDEAEAIASRDRASFVVREYGLGDELTPMTVPEELAHLEFRRVVWSKSLDYPAISKYKTLFEESVYERLTIAFKNHSGIKIGGWPTPVQRGQDYPGSCDLQIDITEDYMFGDSGIGYLSKTHQGWHVRFESL